MKKFAAITICVAAAGAASGAIADQLLAGITLGQTSNNIDQSRALSAQLGHPNLDGVIHRNSTWGVRAGQQSGQMRYYLAYDQVSSERREHRMRQQTLLASADVLIPFGSYETAAFAGVSGGVVRLRQQSRGFHSDSDYGWAGGVQAGVLQKVGDQMSLEAGYRYLRTTADARLQPYGGPRTGHISLRSSGQAYLGVNYRF